MFLISCLFTVAIAAICHYGGIYMDTGVLWTVWDLEAEVDGEWLHSQAISESISEVLIEESDGGGQEGAALPLRCEGGL